MGCRGSCVRITSPRPFDFSGGTSLSGGGPNGRDRAARGERRPAFMDNLSVPPKESQQRTPPMPWEAEPYRRLVESIRDYAIFLLDSDGHVLTWNEGGRQITGYADEQIIGKHFSIFYPQAAIDKSWPQHELETARRLGRFEDEGWRIRSDGGQFWANVVITAVRDEEGRLLGFSKVVRDLTERRQSEERMRVSEERFRLLVSGVQDYAIFLLDPDGHVVSWNEGARRIKGYEASEIIG